MGEVLEISNQTVGELSLTNDEFLDLMHQLEIMAGFDMTTMYILAIVLMGMIAIMGVLAWRR